MKLEKIKWEQHSHQSHTSYYLNTEVGEINGEKIYRHVRTNRIHGGFGIGKSKTTYSKTLQSKDLTEQAVIKMIELAKKSINT